VYLLSAYRRGLPDSIATSMSSGPLLSLTTIRLNLPLRSIPDLIYSPTQRAIGFFLLTLLNLRLLPVLRVPMALVAWQRTMISESVTPPFLSFSSFPSTGLTPYYVFSLYERGAPCFSLTSTSPSILLSLTTLQVSSRRFGLYRLDIILEYTGSGDNGIVG
jgi:hypothetical protein